MNIFLIFPSGLFYFGYLADLSTLRDNAVCHVRPADSQNIIPEKAPNHPASMIDSKEIFGQAVTSCRVIDRILPHDFHSLWQSRVKIKRFRLVIGDDEVIGASVLPKEFDGSTQRSNILLKQVAHV